MGFAKTLAAAVLLPWLFVPCVHAALVAHYTFNETSGTTAAESGGGVSGTLQGSASFAAGGIAGNCVSLSTTNDGVVNMGSNYAFLTGNYSVVFWVKTSTVEADSILVAKHAAGTENGYLFPVGTTGGGGTAGKANFTASSFVTNGVTSTTTVNDNVWHQIVGVYTAGGTHSIYVDGAPAEQTKASTTMVANVANFYVGGVGALGNPTVADGRYTGLFDDLQLYNNVLSDTDINALFATPGSVVPEPAGLALAAVGAAGLLRRVRRRGV